jgi:hypothetical protein
MFCYDSSRNLEIKGMTNRIPSVRMTSLLNFSFQQKQNLSPSLKLSLRKQSSNARKTMPSTVEGSSGWPTLVIITVKTVFHCTEYVSNKTEVREERN